MWTSQFGGEFYQTPEENDVAHWNDVDDECREHKHDNGQPRQPRYFPRQQTVVEHTRIQGQERRAIAGRTARCRRKFRYVSNFATTSCGFPAPARLS